MAEPCTTAVIEAMNEMKRTISELGLRILTANGIVAEARNVHKPVRSALKEAVALLDLLKEQSEATLEMCNSLTGGNQEKTAKEEKSTQTDNNKRKQGTVLKSPRENIEISSETRERGNNAPNDDNIEKENENPWVVAKRKQKKKNPTNVETEAKAPRRKRYGNAIKVAAEDSTTYAAILKELSEKVTPKKDGEEFKSIRKSKAGEYIFALQENASLPAMQKLFQEALKDKARITALTRKTTIEVRNIPDFTTQEEVKEALRKEIGDETEISCSLRQAFYSGTMTAVVTLPASVASDLLQKEKIQIGWVRCTMREKVEVTRCYKCHGYGHIATHCKGEDKQNSCFRCGQEGHKFKKCSNEPECGACNENGEVNCKHVTGSKHCTSYQRALTKKQQWR